MIGRSEVRVGELLEVAVVGLQRRIPLLAAVQRRHAPQVACRLTPHKLGGQEEAQDHSSMATAGTTKLFLDSRHVT